MPIHDWTRADAGTFHFFHMLWIGSICEVLNQGLLPRNYYAMGEQRAIGDEPDVLTLHSVPFGDVGGDDGSAFEPSGDAGGGLLLAPPRRASSMRPTRISTGASRIAWSSGT